MKPLRASLPQRDTWSRWSKPTDDAAQRKRPRDGRGREERSRSRFHGCDGRPVVPQERKAHGA